jgi:hypothetical protein
MSRAGIIVFVARLPGLHGGDSVSARRSPVTDLALSDDLDPGRRDGHAARDGADRA